MTKINGVDRESKLRNAHQTHAGCTTKKQNNTTQSNKWSPFQRRKVLISKSKVWDGGVKLSGPQSTLPCRPKFSLADMPDNGPNAGACGGDIMRVNWSPSGCFI
ncbi:hypothetical protein N7516_006533 [Penicillium verrucosum]|uniref:uncharacterized protein n=1 Tax=Penicillium verrucosum TaxID=60171 RepID=UPI0025457510|nr:uncharacterized protein N7516_006533 [Penicillium verrucosum]KAJ5932044.1 hypothetical protein N7516_006533 [Penicillium verrucosum]